MRKTVCPYCNRPFRRSYRARLSESFCRFCIRDRVTASGFGDLSKTVIPSGTVRGYPVLRFESVKGQRGS